MAQGVVERILSFRPTDGATYHGEKKLGKVEGSTFEAIWKVLPYQMRVTTLPDEPLIAAWTRQPVVALVEQRQCGERVLTHYRTLAYASDIKELSEGLAEKLAAHLHNLQSESFDTLYDGLSKRSLIRPSGEWEL